MHYTLSRKLAKPYSTIHFYIANEIIQIFVQFNLVQRFW